MNAPDTRIEAPTVPGTPFAGGFYMARFFVGSQAFALIVAPKAEGEHKDMEWGPPRQNVAGAVSFSDGLANTDAMVEAGSELAKWARGLRIGGGTDWYLPSQLEALLLWNAAEHAEAFKPGSDGAEAFAQEWYWTSTQYAPDSGFAWLQDFSYGGQYYGLKGYAYRARAVRRVAI